MLETEDFFKQNGASLFKELITTHEKINPIRIFSLEELKEATHNFSNRISVAQSYFCGTFSGKIEDTLVVVKINHPGYPWVDEVVSLSVIKHRNVVKLLGCCIGTETPIVVHELPPNETLDFNLYVQPTSVKLLWTDRLRIATEVADALAYMHLVLHITHGFLHLNSVLLDQSYSAKLNVFGDSVIEKQATSSDVESVLRNKERILENIYHFGIILLHLFRSTGRSPLSHIKNIDDSSSVYNYATIEIMNDAEVKINKEVKPQMEAYIDLTLRCLSCKKHSQLKKKEVVREDELSIKEVVRELRRIRRINQPAEERGEHDNLSSSNDASSSNHASTSYR